MRCSWFKFKNPINLIGWKYFLTMPNFKFKKHLLRFLNLYLAAKNQVDWSIFSWDIADLRILQPDCYRAFWLIAQKPEFSQIWDLCKQKTNNLNFHLTPNPEKSNNTIFGKSLKTFLFGHFWAFLSPFQKKFFSLFSGKERKNTKETERLVHTVWIEFILHSDVNHTRKIYVLNNFIWNHVIKMFRNLLEIWMNHYLAFKEYSFFTLFLSDYISITPLSIVMFDCNDTFLLMFNLFRC